MSPADVGKLTMRQLSLVYARDPAHASAGVSGSGSSYEIQSPREIFYAVWRRRGLLDAAIDLRWAAYEKEGQQSGG